MRRKRNVRYSVSAPNMWWGGRRVGWVRDLSSATYQYANSLPSDCVIIRWFFKKGVRYLREFIKKG